MEYRGSNSWTIMSHIGIDGWFKLTERAALDLARETAERREQGLPPIDKSIDALRERIAENYMEHCLRDGNPSYSQ
ncbi:hypothetical protein COU60_03030 [Candidatus Pacearchaeota archaeon CG10_big_fil_rev_8_21_14_0_10_34_76]|nr:MAG: hypothetical protein COU60_03030 [Candidatus Pacearchaeota archaeon CG10_big_fil_rev_8_21_14_0_10_34_76]